MNKETAVSVYKLNIERKTFSLIDDYFWYSVKWWELKKKFKLKAIKKEADLWPRQFEKLNARQEARYWIILIELHRMFPYVPKQTCSLFGKSSFLLSRRL